MKPQLCFFLNTSSYTSHINGGLVPSSVGRALSSHYAKYATHITLFNQGKLTIIGVHKEIQMFIYSSKGGITCLLSNVFKKVSVHTCNCISW